MATYVNPLSVPPFVLNAFLSTQPRSQGLLRFQDAGKRSRPWERGCFPRYILPALETLARTVMMT